MSPIFVALLKNNELIGPSNLRVNRGIGIFCLFLGRLPGVISPSQVREHAGMQEKASKEASKQSSQPASKQRATSEWAGKQEGKEENSKPASK